MCNARADAPRSNSASASVHNSHFPLAFGLTIIVAFALPSYRQGEASVAGKTAENFDLNLSGKSGRLSDLRGKVVVLNFWATWCPPCIEETPALNRLEKHISPRGGM